jgi:hypothetical protein
MIFLFKKPTAKSISKLVLIFSIFSKGALDYFFAVPDGDKLQQSLATINFAQGHGLTIAHVHAHNLSKIVFDPLVLWPEGYSIFLYPFYLLANKNSIAGAFFVDVLFIAVFLIALKKLLILLDFPVYLINLLVLFNGLSMPDYMVSSAPTDLPAMACCLSSCVLLLVFTKSERKKSSFGIVLGIVNALAGMLRYIYIPISFIIPIFLSWNAIQKKDKRLLIGSGYSLVTTSVLLALFFLLQTCHTGIPVLTNPASVSVQLKGFFLSNLKYTCPFVISALLNLHFYITELSMHTGIAYGSWSLMARIVNFFLALPLSYFFFTYSFKKKLVWKDKEDVFFMAAGLICLVSFMLLCYLSITNSPDMNGIYFARIRNYKWTYVQEGRYFAFTFIFLQIVFVWWLFVYKVYLKRRALQIARLLLIIFFSVEIFHGIYFIARQTITARMPPQSLTKINNKNLVNELVEANLKKGTAIVFTSTNKDLEGWCALSGGNVLAGMEELNDSALRADRPTLLVVALKEEEKKIFQIFFSSHDLHKAGQIGEYILYTYYIKPDENK